MSPLVSPPVSDAVAMTLAGIAYGAPASIARYLREASLLGGDWTPVWIAAPADPPVNFAYLAHNVRDDTYALAIRGTYPDPFSAAYWDDGNQDSPFGKMAPWPGDPDARISAGTAQGLKNLLTLTDEGSATLTTFVATLPAEASLTVTGHSLGGTLAPVLALSLSRICPKVSLWVTSFAGMTPGNKAFAALLGTGTPFEGRVRRVFNNIDSVAYGWDKVFATHDFFDPAPKGGLVVSAMLLATAARLDLGGYDFAPVGKDVPLTGIVEPVAIPCDLIAFVVETLHQHMPDTYLALLHAPPLPFSILFGNAVVPRNHPAAQQASLDRLPVVYLD